MPVRFWMTGVAALLWSAGAFGACISGTPSCPDLSNIPEIAQNIVGQEKPVTPAQVAPPSDPSSSYTGPTFGVSNALRRAPEVGYHWSIE